MCEIEYCIGWFADCLGYLVVFNGDRSSTVVKVLCYKFEGGWFDPSWCQCIFHWHNILPIALWPWGRQPLTEMSTRSISWGKGGRCVRLTTLLPSCAVVMKSGNLNFLEPSGPLQACNRTALPLVVFNTDSSTLGSTHFWVLIVYDMHSWFILVMLHTEGCLECYFVWSVLLYRIVLYCHVLHCSTLPPGINQQQ